MQRKHASHDALIITFAVTAILAASLLLAPRASLAFQDGPGQITEDWSEPANLSQSGGASNPSMLIDSSEFYIFWDDEYAGNFLVTGDHMSWSQPLSVTTPFSGTAPLLVGDNAQNVYAFWRDVDEEELFLFSNASSPTLAEENAWSTPQTLDSSILDYDALVDDNGVIHIVYASTTLASSRRSGIYYQFSQDQGANWSEPVALFESPYFRSLAAADANVVLEMAVDAGNTFLYAGWDLRPLKRLYLTISANGGQSWSEATEVAEPESASNIILPFNLRVGANGGDVLLLWHVGQREGDCQLVYQSSTDHGATWTQQRQIDDLEPGIPSCPSENEILAGSDRFYLLPSFQDQAFLLAWNGEQWSEPQAQHILRQFNNPETLNTVNLGCKQAAVTNGDRLYVAGCDVTGLTQSEGDIWFLNRPLGSAESWFPSSETWSRSGTIVEGPVLPHDPQLISDSSALTHAIWAQAPTPDEETHSIFHSQWDGAGWTQPAQILTSPEPISELLAMTRSAADRVYVFWTTTSGHTLLSHAQAGQLQIAVNWSPTESLPLDASSEAISKPAITVGPSGTIYVAYAISINQQRGIYLIQSDDNGQTWTPASMLFDGQAAGWQIVGSPQLAVAPDDTLHLLFEERKWGPGSGSTSSALYYMRCAGSGSSNCSSPELVEDAEIMWKEIVATGPSSVHRLWQSLGQEGAGQLTLQHQVSADGGASWSQTNVLAATNEVTSIGETTVFGDATGRLYLFRAVTGAIQSWIWENDAWRPDQNLSQELVLAIEHQLAADISQGGDLVLAYVDEAPLPIATDDESNEAQYALLAMDRLVGDASSSPPAPATAPATTATTSEGVTPDPTAVETQTTDPTALPTLAAVIPEVTPQDGAFALPFLDSENPLFFLIIGVAPVILLIVVALIIVLRRNRPPHR